MGCLKKASQIVVIAEDELHQRFVRRYLYRLNYSNREIRFTDLPSGRGCGEQLVRKLYAAEVKAFRRRSATAETALIVVIDADTTNVDRRRAQLKELLDENGLNPRRDDERIAHIIPKRNIETWIYCLRGDSVDEDTDYKNHSTLDPKLAAESFFDLTRRNFTTPDYCVQSLKEAIPEVQRLET